jgi:hypothetical protein
VPRPPPPQKIENNNNTSYPGTRVIELDMAAMDGPPFTKQGELKKLAGFLNSKWQTCSFALTSGQPPTLRFSGASAASGGYASSSHGNGCIALLSSSAAAATPGTSTDFTVTNAEYAQQAVLGHRTLHLRADTQRARDEWVAPINAEIRSAAGSGEAAAASASPSPSAPVVYSFGSLDQELRGIASPPADVVELRGISRVLTLEDKRLLVAKLHSSPVLRELNLGGTVAAVPKGIDCFMRWDGAMQCVAV